MLIAASPAPVTYLECQGRIYKHSSDAFQGPSGLRVAYGFGTRWDLLVYNVGLT